MKNFKLVASLLFVGILFISGCVSDGLSLMGEGASQRSNAIADQNMYQPVEYINASKQGPVLVVLPGNIKSSNATFSQKITDNNIADYGELELGKANFRVLERAELGPMLNEVTLAANMGDSASLKKFRKGKFKTTKWFVKFDILKAENVAEGSKGFNGAALGSILSSVVGGTSGAVAGTTLGSVKSGEAAGVWIVGMRYKVLDASTSEQVYTGYFEDKMELGKKGSSILGVSGSQSAGITLDSMVQRLVQKAVADLDLKK